MHHGLSTNRTPKNSHAQFALRCSLTVLHYLQRVSIHISNVSFLVHREADNLHLKLFNRARDFGGPAWGKISGRELQWRFRGSSILTLPSSFGGKREDSLTDFACLTPSRVINLHTVVVSIRPELPTRTSLLLFLVGNLHLIYTS